MRKQHVVRLTDDERAALHHLLAGGRAPVRQLTHARILLKADQGPEGPAWTDARIVAALDVGRATVERVRKRYAAEGLEAALVHRAPRATKARTLDGRQEAQLIALACSGPPPGRERWSLRLLADKLVELEVVEAVSHETVRQALKQTSSSRGANGSGASHRSRTPSSRGAWRMSWTSTPTATTRASRRSASTRRARSCSPM